MWRKGRRGQQSLGGQRGQSNFELAANFGYDSRGSTDPRESLRKRRILKLALTAHKVLSARLCCTRLCFSQGEVEWVQDER